MQCQELIFLPIGAQVKAGRLRERLEVQGVEISATTPEQFAKFIRDEIVRWGKAVKLSGAKPD